MSALDKYDRVTVQWNNIRGTLLIKKLCVIKNQPVVTMDRKGKDFSIHKFGAVYHKRHPTLNEYCPGSY